MPESGTEAGMTNRDEYRRFLQAVHQHCTDDTPLVGAHLSLLMEKYAAAIDDNGDGAITQAELGKSIAENKKGGEITELLCAVRLLADGGTIGIQLLKHLLADSDKSEKDERIQEILPQFDLVDQDHDGFLSKTELESAVLNPSIDAATRQNVLFASQKFQALADLSNDEWGTEDDGITKNDLGLLKVRSLNYVCDLYGAVARARMAEHIPLKLYRDDDASMSINPEAVNQGRIGDCWLMAALASLSYRDPDSIKQMIRPHGASENSKFAVTFPGKAPLVVDAPGRAELALFAAGDYGVWPGVLEKAYGRLVEGLEKKSARSKLPQDALAGGGYSQIALQDLTGHRYGYTYSFDPGLEDDLKAMTRSKLPYVAGSKPTATEGIAPGHAYSILSYNAEKKLVILRNPWGQGEPNKPGSNEAADGVDDGIFAMPLTEFKRQFYGVALPH